MKFPVYLSLFLFFLACSNSGGNITVASVGEEAYEMEEIPGQTAKIARKVDESGNILERGQIENGLKVGTWLTYDAGKEFPKKIETFIGGAYNGPYMEMNERGQVTLSTFYKNNLLHGPWAKYQFGRTTESAHYKGGQLDGVYRSYYQRDGKIQKEFNYKNGKLDGPYRFFNEEGQVTLEYTYKDGEKVGGGIVEPKAPEDSE